MIRQIAEGGFSTVDLVEDCETGKKFALKRILCHSIEDQNVALQVCRFAQGKEQNKKKPTNVSFCLAHTNTL